MLGEGRPRDWGLKSSTQFASYVCMMSIGTREQVSVFITTNIIAYKV